MRSQTDKQGLLSSRKHWFPRHETNGPTEICKSDTYTIISSYAEYMDKIIRKSVFSNNEILTVFSALSFKNNPYEKSAKLSRTQNANLLHPNTQTLQTRLYHQVW
jgi:hypothetical protein